MSGTEISNDDAEDMFLSQALDEYEEKKECVRFAKPSSAEDIKKKKIDKKQIIYTP